MQVYEGANSGRPCRLDVSTWNDQGIAAEDENGESAGAPFDDHRLGDWCDRFPQPLAGQPDHAGGPRDHFAESA
jgi:hypothetical protein